MGGATGEIFIMSIQPRIYISSKIYVDINGVIAVKNKYNVKTVYDKRKHEIRVLQWYPPDIARKEPVMIIYITAANGWFKIKPIKIIINLLYHFSHYKKYLWINGRKYGANGQIDRSLHTFDHWVKFSL